VQAYLTNLAVLIGINAILAVSLNFVLGYAGIFSMAHAVFFGVGAYTATLVAAKLGGGFIVSTLAGMTAAGVLSLALALPALRVRGEYFVAASLGLQMLAITVFSEWKAFTGGIGGITNIPPASILGLQLGSPGEYLVLTLVCLAGVMLVLTLLVRGSFGRSLKAIRDNETAAATYGKNVAVIKTIAVATSSALAAVGGSLYAFYMSFVNVESFVLDTSVLLIAMVIIGGVATMTGPIVGTVLILLLPAALSYLPGLPATEIGSIQQMVYGVAMVLLMIFRPGGVWSQPRRGEGGR
jgi:branched-chain amino acid transport system permease protein